MVPPGSEPSRIKDVLLFVPPVTYKRDDPATVFPGNKFEVDQFTSHKTEPTALKLDGTPVAAVLCVVPSLKRISVFLSVVGMITP